MGAPLAEEHGELFGLPSQTLPSTAIRFGFRRGGSAASRGGRTLERRFLAALERSALTPNRPPSSVARGCSHHQRGRIPVRVAIIYRPRNPAPLEAVPMLLEAMGQWVENHGERFSTLEFFVGGGGFGVIDIDDSAELQQIAAENPFTAFSDVEIKPVVEPGTAMAILRETFAARAQASD
jgi:Domain of unknown function (DUF3303)